MDTMDFVSGMSRLVLGWVFLVVGGLQVFLAKTEAVRLLGGWARGYSPFALKLMGVAELAAGAAVVLPLIVTFPDGVQAATGVAIILIMGSSMIVYARRRQYLRFTASCLLAGLSGFNLHWVLAG